MNSYIGRLALIFLASALVLTGCATTTVKFGIAKSTPLKALETSWQKNIKPTNTYFAYAVKIKPEGGGPFICNKGKGTPFSDFEQTYSLVLAPNDGGTTSIKDSTLAQPVVLFEKDKTTCKAGDFNRLITPFKLITHNRYTVNRIDLTDEKVTIEYDKILEFVSSVTRVAAAIGSGGATELVAILDNDLNRAAYAEATKGVDNILKQWIQTNEQSAHTLEGSIIKMEYGQVVFNQFSIPIELKKGDAPTVTIGHIIIYPEFRRTIWADPAQVNNIENVTIQTIGSKNLSEEIRVVSSHGITQTYGSYLDSLYEGDISLSILRNIGKDIDWNHPDTAGIVSEQEKLISVCEQTKTALKNEGMHILDQQLFLAKRMEHAPLWAQRIKHLPELQNKYSMLKKGVYDALVKEHEEIKHKKSVDLSQCLDPEIQLTLNNGIVTPDKIQSYLKEWREVKTTLGDKRMISHFTKNVWKNLIRNREVEIEEEKKQYRTKYADILSDDLNVLSEEMMVTFIDKRIQGNEDWFGPLKSQISAREALGQLWDMELYLYGCFLQPTYSDLNGDGLDINSVQMLYLSHDNEIGTVTFSLPYGKDDPIQRHLEKVSIESITSVSDIYLSRVKNGSYEENSNCMNKVYPNVMQRLQ
jgi:hypothetical protein